MNKWIVRVFFVVLSLMVLTSQVVFAQTEDTVTILNESTTALNEPAIREAAAPWVSKGHYVYVYVTDARIETEDDWWAIRDRVEDKNWGIYHPITDTFNTDAVVIELTTDTNQDSGQDFGYGEMLQKTPLNTQTNSSMLESRMRELVSKGDVNGAIIWALQTAYPIAYPAPAPVPATATAVPPTPRPTMVPTPAPQVTQANGEPIRINFGLIIALFILGVGGYFVVAKVALPIWAVQKKNGQMGAQIENLRSRIPHLLTKCSEFFSGTDVESTPVYNLWSANGGKQYAKRDALMREYIRGCMTALDTAYEKWKHFKEGMPTDSEAVKKLLNAVEVIYFSLVGEQKEVLEMTEEQQLRLLDPTYALTEETVDIQLVEQLKALDENPDSKNLMVDHLAANLDKVDDNGILGYIRMMKVMLRELEMSAQDGPKKLAEAQDVRKKLGTEIQVPAILADRNVFQAVDNLIADAEKAAKAQEWLTVEDLAQKALGVLELLSGQITLFSMTLNLSEARQVQLDAILSKGYQLDPQAKSSQEEVAQDTEAIILAILVGNDAKVQEYIHELDIDSTRALKTQQEMVALHQKNVTELAKLAQEVSRVSNIREDDAEDSVTTAWARLQRYPRSNWETVASSYEQASSIVESLSHNVSQGKIAQANSLKEQRFAEAEKLIAEAFVQLDQAEKLFDDISDRYHMVLRLKIDTEKAWDAAKDDIEKARGRRDQDNEMIDAAVDSQITEAAGLLASSREHLDAQEFTQASEQVGKARELAHSAYSQADQQVEKTKRLFADFKTAQTATESAYQQMTIRFGSMLPVVQTRKVELLKAQADNLYRQAQHARQSFTSKDDELREDLQGALDSYHHAEEAIRQVMTQLDTDQAEYDQAFSETKRMIERAHTAVIHATPYVREAGVGHHELDVAFNLIPQEPPVGESLDGLNRRKAQALQAEQSAQHAESIASDQIIRDHERDEQAAQAAAALAGALISAAVTHSQRPREEHHEVPHHVEPHYEEPHISIPVSHPTHIAGNSSTRGGASAPVVHKTGNSRTR